MRRLDSARHDKKLFSPCARNVQNLILQTHFLPAHLPFFDLAVFDRPHSVVRCPDIDRRGCETTGID